MSETQDQDLSSAATTSAEKHEDTQQHGMWLAGASVLGSVLASACCIVPLALFSLGIGGAWMANLTALAPYKPIFIVLAAGLILAGFVSMRRRRRRACDINGYCASTLSTRITYGALWFSTLLVIAVLLWPYLLPIIMGE